MLRGYIIKKIIIVVLILLISVAGYFLIKKLNKKVPFGRNNQIVTSVDEIHPFGFTSLSNEEAEVAKEVGDTIVRASIGWYQIEPQMGKFNFDKFKGSSQEANFTPLIRFRMQKGWATQCKTNLCPANSKDCPRALVDCPPKDLGNWSEKGYSPLLYDLIYKTLEFAQSKNLKNYNALKIIVGNEVNSPQFWLGTPEDYFKTRGTIYKAANDINKKYNTQYAIIDNGVASAVWEYAIAREAFCNGQKSNAKDFAERTFRRENTITQIDQEVAQTDCNRQYSSQELLDLIFKVDPNLKVPSFDYMSYHFYEPWDVQEEIINWIKEKMAKNGYNRSILNTEGGFIDRNRLSYDKYPELKKEVANDIVKIHVVAFANNVYSWLWLPLIENYTGDTTGQQLKGLETPDGTKLPAYYSYKTMINLLDGFKSVEKISGLSSKYVYKFTFKNKNPVFVLWDTKNSTIDFSSILNGDLRVLRVDGTTQNMPSTDLNISESPIYIET